MRKRLSLALTLECYQMLSELARADGLAITQWLEMTIRRIWKEAHGEVENAR